MQEIEEYLKNKKRTFAEGVKLYNKHGKEFVPEFNKYKAFFGDVSKEQKAFAQGMLETKLGYILRMDAQFTERAKKKKDIPKAIKTDEDLKAEAEALKLKEQEEAEALKLKEEAKDKK